MATQSSTATQSPTARGQQRWFFGMLAEVKASAADTGGQYSLVEVTAPAGLQVPLHVHYADDEDFIEDVSVPAERPTVPPASVTPPENAAEIVLRHGMELLPG